jgi:hypothetical protein
MKKINRLKDPFLQTTLIDSMGLTALFGLLLYRGTIWQHPFWCLLFFIVLSTFCLLRTIFTSVSINLTGSLVTLRLIKFNTTVDIKMTRIVYMRAFGQRRLYLRRIQLLRNKRDRIKATYTKVLRLVEILWKEGYKGDALIYVMDNMVGLSKEINKLSRSYRKPGKK